MVVELFDHALDTQHLRVRVRRSPGRQSSRGKGRGGGTPQTEGVRGVVPAARAATTAYNNEAAAVAVVAGTAASRSCSRSCRCRESCRYG